MAAVVPYALSIHGFIDKVGAYAGFAAIIGVALVVIMLFVHAREAASLRERAEDAEDRVDYLERTVEHLGRVASQALALAQTSQSQASPSRPGVAAAPAAARTATSAQRPVPAPAVAAAYAGGGATQRAAGPPPQLPAAPVGTAGPALSSATRLLPEPGTVSPNGKGSYGNLAPGATPAAEAPPAPGAPPAPAPAPAPTNAAAAAPAPPPSTAAAGAPLPRGSRTAGGERPQPGDAGTQGLRRNYGRASEPRSSRRILPFVVVAVLVAAIAVAAVLVFAHHHHTKGNGPAASGRTHSSATSGARRKGKHAVAVNPRTVTVAVLNGTTTNKLAADVSQKLGKLGFKQGKTGNFTNQNQTTTTIGFVPGHRAQALAVAKALKVKYSKVLKVNASTQQLVCPVGASCPDQVFVVLGTDLNFQA